MKKTLRFLIWFLINWHLAMKIYRYESFWKFVNAINVYEYHRPMSEIQQCRSIIWNHYYDYPKKTQKFFCSYYLYRVLRKILLVFLNMLVMNFLCIYATVRFICISDLLFVIISGFMVIVFSGTIVYLIRKLITIVKDFHGIKKSLS